MQNYVQKQVLVRAAAYVREDKVPAILYGADKEAASIVLAQQSMIKAQEDEGFYTHILTLNIGGESVEAILKIFNVTRSSLRSLT